MQFSYSCSQVKNDIVDISESKQECTQTMARSKMHDKYAGSDIEG